MSSINVQTANGLIEIGGKVTEEKIISALGYTPADKDELIDNIIDDESAELTVADESGNVIMTVGTEGIHTTEIIANGIEVGKTVSEHVSDDSIHVTAAEKNTWNTKSDFSGFYQDLEEAPNITEDSSGNLVITDDNGNIVMQVDSNGLETTTVTAKSVIVNGVDVEDLNSHISNTDIHITDAERDSWNQKIGENASGITSLESSLSSHTADSVSHITADERTLWNNKSDFSGDYNDLQNAPSISEDNSGEISYADEAGNVIAKINSEGLETTQVIVNAVVVNGTTFDGTYDSLSDIPTDLATQSYVDEKVDAKVAAVVGSAPEVLDTLDELAAALGDDANFATTVTESIAQKASQSDLNAHTSDTTIHITASERTTWNAKSDFSGSYNDLIDTPNILDDESAEFSVTDDSGNVVFKVDSDGSHTTSLEAETIILGSEDLGEKITQYISDTDTKIANHTHTVSNITDLTATATELNYVNGVTSNVQTQLDEKAPAYTYGTEDLTAGESALETGKLYIVYE